MTNQSILNISWGTIAKIIIATIAIYIIFLIQNIIVWFIFALVIAILFNYVIDILEKKRIPRILSAGFLYLCVFALISYFIYKTAPVILSEFKDFAQNFPVYLQRISPLFEKIGIDALKNTDALLSTLQSHLNSASASVLSALFSIFGGASSTILVIAMAFFISVERNFIERVLALFAPKKYKDYLFKLWGRSKRKVSGWFITRMIGVVFVGGATYLVLSLLNVKYALLLSIIVGVFDIVPVIGPIVAGAALFTVVALSSLMQALFVGITLVIVQLLENNLLFPVLFRKFVGLSPVLVLVALAVGAKLWGVAGAVLAIPLAGVIFEVLKDYLKRMRKDEKQDEKVSEHVPAHLELQ